MNTDLVTVENQAEHDLLVELGMDSTTEPYSIEDGIGGGERYVYFDVPIKVALKYNIAKYGDQVLDNPDDFGLV